MRAQTPPEGLAAQQDLLAAPQEVPVAPQERVELFPLGDMDQWAVRFIKESGVLGGETKLLYAVSPTDTLYRNAPFDFSQTPWGVSNAYSRVAGVTKVANTLYPEPRGNGFCARLEAKMETVRVMGMVDIRLAISGTLFLGTVFEPARSVKDPYSMVSYGIPFSERPQALVFDVKAQVSPEQTLTKAEGSGVSQIPGHDEPQIYLFLQKRWEENGAIYATRIGTAFVRIPQSIPEWIDGFRLPIYYGEAAAREALAEYEAIMEPGSPRRDVYKSPNSKGKVVAVQEIGWADAEETPTHIVLVFAAGCYPAFNSHVGNCLWLDNIGLVYEQ